VFISARQQDQGPIQNYVKGQGGTGSQLHSRKLKPIRGERERESRFLTTHQHILGYTMSFTLYMIFTRWTADNLKWQMTGYSN